MGASTCRKILSTWVKGRGSANHMRSSDLVPGLQSRDLKRWTRNLTWLRRSIFSTVYSSLLCRPGMLFGVVARTARGDDPTTAFLTAMRLFEFLDVQHAVVKK